MLSVRTPTVVIPSKKVTMITSNRNLSLVSSLRRKVLHFLLSSINKLDRDSCIDGFYHLFAPWETTWHCFYPISPRVERWWVLRKWCLSRDTTPTAKTNNKLYLQVQSQAAHPQNARSIKKKSKAMGKIEKISHPNAW